MVEPKIKRAILVTLLSLVFIGAYHVADFRDAPAEISEEIAAGEQASRSTSAVSPQGERRPDADPKPEVPSEIGRAHGFPELEVGLEAFQPAELYAQYVDEANDGNVDAQYVLVTVLGECRHLPATKDEIAELERSGVPSDVVQAVKDRFQRCEPLFDELADLENEYQQRYRAVRDANHPLLIVKQRKLPLDEKRRLVIEAISHEYPEPYLYAGAYIEAAILHREYPEKLNILREEAWLLLYCAASFHCDSKKEFEYMRTEKYHEHEIDEILTIYSSITTAIKRRDWDALGI